VKKIIGTALALIITAGVIVYCVMCGESVSVSLFFVVLFLIQAQLVS
ncbi:MAG: peptidase M50, partial [Ruminiclostridium sp.]|nr:peptidase M50 [Ruminiclostridium sp.]